MRRVSADLAVDEGQPASKELRSEDEGDGEENGGRPGEVESSKDLAAVGGVITFEPSRIGNLHVKSPDGEGEVVAPWKV